MPRLLIVEDEPVLRASIVRGLAKLPGLEVFDCGTLGDALATIDASPMDLIISDIDLPDRSALELIGELGRRGMQTPLVFISAYLQAYRSQIPPHARVEVLEKPVPLELLRARVMAKLDVAPSKRAPFSLAEYLQLACLGRHSLRMTVAWGEPRHTGECVVLSGEPWSAEDDLGHGADALKRLVNRREAAVECVALTEAPGSRNVEGQIDQILLDAAVEEDEQQHTGALAAASIDALVAAGAVGEGMALADVAGFGMEPHGATAHGVPVVSAAAAASSAPPPTVAAGPEDIYKAAVEAGVSALLDKDYPAALAAFEQARALRPGDTLVETNLRRLAQLGFAGGRGGTA